MLPIELSVTPADIWAAGKASIDVLIWVIISYFESTDVE